MMCTFHPMAFTMRDQAAAANHMVERLERQTEENPGMNVRGARVDQEYLKLSEFMKVNPPSFHGTFNSDRVDELVKQIERIFSVLLCIE